MPGKKILVVDDDEGFVRIVQYRLQKNGYKVSCAYSGEGALKSVTQDRPDLILLDVVMRPMDGIGVYKRLKADPETRGIPVMFISGKFDNVGPLKNLGVNPESFLSKPYDPEDFFSKIEINLKSGDENGRLEQEAQTDALKGDKDMSLGQTIVLKGLVSQDKMDAFLKKGRKRGESIIKDLVKNGLAEEKQILISLSDTFNLPYIELKDAQIEQEAVAKIPTKYAWHYLIMPVRMDGGQLVCAIADPLNVSKVTDDIKVYLRLNVKLVLTREEQIIDAIKKYYGIGAETVDKIMSDGSGDHGAPAGQPDNDEDIAKLAGDASVIKLVNQILIEAQQKKATDIHIEPYKEKLRVRYRIDGVLQDVMVPPEIVRFLPAIISRIKIMSGLDIVERRLPQDGRANVRIKDELFDLRISTLPSPHGESIVIRILPGEMIFSLEKLGFLEDDLKKFKVLIKRPHGIIFVTGPTGSGKTTTLYAALTQIKSDNPGAKIITIEDPMEYELEGITQIQVNPDISLTFARGLRSMLRHDPDLMMVGEVRDFETAEIAIRMALTGHLLFSTLHTNDAASGITRLLDIGIEPYLVASSVEAFVAQRLVRVICRKCREADPLKGKGLGISGASRGKGCEECGFTGYSGRTALFEILAVDDDIKEMIIKKIPANEIKKKAVANGMRTLWDDGKAKIEKGITTADEVLRVTQFED